MNFSKQLKKYREQHNFSQEVLAEKIYVTRQTISKWENDKSYPDIHNLIALSVLFDVSLDELVKGDTYKMKQVVNDGELKKHTKGMIIFLTLTLLVGVPCMIIWAGLGLIPFGIFSALSMYYALKVEKIKKVHNIKTYREILAFTEGEPHLDQLREGRSKKKALIEKILIVLAFSLIVSALAVIISLVTNFFIH